MDSFDDTRQFDPDNPSDSVGSSVSDQNESAAASESLEQEPKAHLSLSQMKLDFSKKRITPLQRRVSDRTNRFLKSYVNPPQLESSSKFSEAELVNEEESTDSTELSPPSSTGVDLARFFQEKLLSSEDTPSVPDEVEENLLDYKPKKPSRKVSAGEVFRQELRAIKQRGALERMKQELKEEVSELPEEALGREDVIGEFDIPPFDSSEEAESVPSVSEPSASKSLEQEPVEVEAAEKELFTDEEKAHLAKIREMAPEKSDPSFPFPSYLDEDLNPTEPKRAEAEPTEVAQNSEPEIPVVSTSPEPEPETVSESLEQELQELPAFAPKSLEQEPAPLSAEEAPPSTEPSPPPNPSEGQVLFERKPRVTEEGPGPREIFSRDPGLERPAEQAQTVWTRPETRDPVSQSFEQESASEGLEQNSEPASENLEPESETPLELEPEAQPPPKSPDQESEADDASQSLELEPEVESALERKPRVFRRSRTNPQAALNSPSPRQNIADMVTQPLSGKSFDREEEEPAQQEPPTTEGESPD